MSDFVTAAEAAELLGCSDTQIRRRIREGKLTATKMGGHWQISRSYLDRLTVADVRPTDRQTVEAVDEQTDRPAGETTDEQTDRPAGGATDEQTDRHTERQTDVHAGRQTDWRTAAPEWRADLLAQLADVTARLERSEEERTHVHEDAMRREAESKARAIDLERELTVRDSGMADLRRQVADQDAEMKAVLSKGQDEALQLANRIADLVERQQAADARIVELAPVAEQVPMLQAAVDEKDAALTGIQQDIEEITKRPVAGPVFRLLTKGKLRI